ncbi:hypothetical protein ACF0H5_012344 [Mactra antiquata]
MPSSSRRKQSRPQHLSNDHDDKDNKTKDDTINPQDASTKVKVTDNKNLPENLEINGIDSIADTTSDVEDENDDYYVSETEVEHAGELAAEEPHDLSSKVKVNHNNLDRDLSESSVDNYSVGQEFQAKGKNMENKPLALTTEASFQCPECKNFYRSKEVLKHHIEITHDTEVGDVSIAQHPSFSRKRPLNDSHVHTDESVITNPAHRDVNSTHHETHPNHYEPDAASKHRKMDTHSPLAYYRSAIPPHLAMLAESSYDIQMKAYEATLKSSSFNEMSDFHVCQVCSKMFPKPSDLKRHMMCHTGEKPFRCELCSKPFRAKSSMHYHLKATHGLDIELSPGLEERYLRMKTRAQMNLLQRGHVSSFPTHLAGSESGNYRRDHTDYDDIEEESKSIDNTFFQSSGNGSDINSETLSQGSNGQTGNDSKSALDLSMAGKNKLFTGNTQNLVNGEVIKYQSDPLKKSKLSVQNETILVTRLDGLDMISGDNASVFKCYLCTSTFSSLSELQCHLSIHFKKQVVIYQCCFCDKVFHYKMQMQNHLKCHHLTEISSYTKDTSFIENGQSVKEGSFPCRFCHKIFDNKISLHKHARLHLWNRNCFCRICGKNFNHYTSLQIHISRFHWKTAGKAKNGSSWIRRNIGRMKRLHHTKPRNYNVHTAMEEPLNLIHKTTNQNATQPNQNVTVVMPQSPPSTNGNISDTAYSQHSSDHNWSESLSDNPVHDTDDGDVEIRSAPKRSLLPLKRDTSPRGRSSRKSTPVLSAYHNHATSDNDLPLNFSKSDVNPQDRNNNESSDLIPPNRSSPELTLPITATNPEAILPGYALNATNQMLMAKALAAHQSLTHHLNNTSQPMIFPPNHLPPSLAAMTQMMSLPGISTPLIPESRAGTSKSPSPASHSSSKSDTSPEDRDSKEGIRDGMMGYPRVQWGQDKSSSLWSFNMYSPPDTGHTDGRKVTSLSRTHSRLGIVQSPINREAMCKPTTLTDGRTVYKCPFCSKEFVSFSDINRHMDFHEGKIKDIRPYKCHYCDYYARTNSQLKVHMMRHQGIREFCCKLCNYKGVTQSDLNRHMKSQIHMLKSRNACTYCGEGFVTTKNLEKHLDGNCIVKMQKLNGGLDIPLQERVA